ncbi:MAG: glycosyltransferase family A protein [Verrucomicrobiota bacterium]|jgi:glycosyltransferase involved in cell wall biosynthesis
MNSTRYVVITPVRNEGKHLPQTIESMACQTIRPAIWVIVNDGSSDNTGHVADAAAAKHSWIRVVHRSDRGFRKSGGGVIEAFYDGCALVQSPDWDFLGKLDGDLAFGPGYFEGCLARFRADAKLGIGGGRVYSKVNGSFIEDAPGDPLFHVRGATKIYRRATWEAIGGLLRVTGWDTLDELKANMLGWRSYSFKELKVQQLKPTGSADGTWKNWFKNGQANYISGYHPLFMVSKCIRRLFCKPYGIGAAGLFCGFVSSYWNGVPRVADEQLIRYIRRQQMHRLLLRDSLWR